MAEKRTFQAYIPKINPSKDFSGFSHNIFVGRFGYPNVNVGFLTSEQKNKLMDNPRLWAKNDLGIPKIMDYRMAVLNSKYGLNVKQPKVRFYDTTTEIAQASTYADVEVNLERTPFLGIKGGNIAPPFAATGKLKNITVTNNIKIPKRIDKAINDTDWKATESIPELFSKRIDENYLVKLLSSGSLGLQAQRKLVPTRWSITAVDDTIGKNLINEIKYNEIKQCEVLEGSYLGNYYIIILLPQSWAYELFEISTTTSSTWHDYEAFEGRKKYADETAGGYYAARLGILEYMKAKKMQAAPLVFRFVTNEYYQQLGVWVVREAVRKTMHSQPKYMDKDTAIKYAINAAKNNFQFFIGNFVQRSILLREGQQKRLFDY